MPAEYSGQSELQKLLRSLRPAGSSRAKAGALFPQGQRRGEKPADCSVAERVRQVEQVASEGRGYSTRVNFGAGEATVVDEAQEPAHSQRLFKVSDYPKPVWQRREESMVTRGASAAECPDEAPARPQQRSVATAILPSYSDDCDRLRAVETLVSTRSGQPKITSISLRYGEDTPPHQPAPARSTEAVKFTSKTCISAERTHSSSNGLAEDKAPSAYLKSSYAPQSYPLPSKNTPTNQAYPSKITATTHSYPLSTKITPMTQSYSGSSKITTTTPSYPLSSKVTPTTQSYPLSSKITTTTPSYPLSSKITPTTPSYPLSSKVTPATQSYPLSSKVTSTNERNVSRTTLDASVEKNQSHTRERKTLFDRSDVTTSSELEPERRTVAKQTTTQSDSPSRGLSFSHFDKKPFNSQKSNSPVSKPSQLPTDAVTTSEVSSERSTFAKQMLHSEPTSRTATVSSVEKHSSSRVSSSSVCKQSSNHVITTNPQNSTTLINPKVISSHERKLSNPSNSPLRSQSPRTSSFSSQLGEGSDKSASPCHRSSPRSRGSSESQGGVKLDTITSSSSSRVTASSLQRRDSREKTGAAVQTLAGESIENSQKADRLTADASSPAVGHTAKSSHVARDSRRVTRSTSKSPTPTKKVTPPSKNSKPKDFIGRVGTDSPTYQNSRNSTSPSNTLRSARVQSSSAVSTRGEEHSSLGGFPIYQNSGLFPKEPLEQADLSGRPGAKQYDCGLDLIETDSAILEELTRAADQILQAVNGYTDEESRRASSDDDNRRPRERRSATLGTISEAPLRSLAEIRKETAHHKSNGVSARRAQRVSSKTKLGPTSSTSSVESFTRETRRAAVKTERSSSAATSSRTARMVQRANSRELLLQTNASSSEDIASGSESKKQRAPPPRRSRASSSSNKDQSSTRSKDKLKDGLDGGSRTKERVSTSRGKSRDASDSRESRRKVPETKHHPVKEKTIPAASGLTGGRERSSHARHCTTSTRTSKTPNNQEKTSSSSKRRSESAVQI